MLLGYARVSKSDGSQNLDLQQDALKAYGVEEENIYSDYASGKLDDRPLLCARYTSPPLRQMRSPLYTNFFVSYCHPPF